MAQRDSELVVRLRDEASKTFEAIKKAGADFAAGMQDTSKTATATGGVFQRLAQSIVELGKSANALAGVSKISDQLARAASSVESLEKKLATATSEFARFQAQAKDAAAVTEAAAARAKAAEVAVTAQAKSVAALNAANKQNTQATKDADTALEKLTARLAKTKGGSDAMAAEAQKQAAALEALRAKQAQSQTGYDAEKVKLDALTAARKEATTAQGQAESAQNKANASLKTATGNIDNLTAGLGVARAGLAEIEGIFQAGAGKAGLMTASVDALGAAQTKLKTLTDAATAALRAQTDIGGPKASAAATARLSDFQGALSRETARRAALAEAATRPTALAAPETARLVASAPAADATAAFRAQRQAVTDADAAYKTAQADLAALYRTMGEAGTRTIEQTVAIETQRAAIENSRAVLAREREELIRFRDAARAAAQARASDAQAAVQEAAERENAARDAATRQAAEAVRAAELARVELARKAADAAATKTVADRQAAEDAARARAAAVTSVLSPGSGRLTSANYSVTAALRDQKNVVDQAREAYVSAREQLDALQRAMAGIIGKTREQTAALASQKAETDALEAALERETVALRAISSAIDAARGREASQTDQRVQAVLAGVAAPSARAASSPIAGEAAPDPDVALRARAAAAAAYREQVATAATAIRAYEGQQAALAALAGAMSTAAKATAEETAAIADQRATVATAEGAMNREIAALREMRDAISTTAAARRAGVSAEIIALGSMNEIRDSTARTTATVREQVTILGALRNGLMAANAASREYAAAAAQTGETHNALAGGIKNLVSAYVNVFLAADAFRRLISSAVDTEAAQVRITTALGQGQEAGAAAFEHAANAARALKVDILPAVNAYAQFLGVVRDTPLEGRNATRVFDDLLVTIRAFKLAPENMQRVIQALTDIAARGHVATREMNQLDLALPVGLRQAIGQAAGFGANQMEDFTKALRAGKVSLDVLPAAFDIVAKKAREGLPAALQTAQSSFADFRNAVYDFGVAISNGDFMKGIVDGVNSITAVLKDPQASQGLRAIANGFGEILTIISALLPQARILVIALSGLTAVKLVSMVASFAGIRAAIVTVVDSILAWRAAFALLGASAVLPGIAATLSSLIPVFLGPAGIIALVALVGAGFAYWVTGTRSAEDALNSYKQTITRIADSLRQSGGDFTKFGQGEGSIQVSTIEQQLKTQQQAYKDTGSALDNYINRLGILNSVMGNDVQAREVGQVVDLGKAYLGGGISVQDFQGRIQALNRTLSTDEGKKRADELSNLAGAHKNASDEVDVLRGALVKNGATLVLTEAEMKRAIDASNKLREQTLNTANAFKNEGVAGFEAYMKAIDDLDAKIPGLKEKLDMRNAIDDAKKTLASGLGGIQAELGQGMISEQQAAARRQALIQKESLLEADLRAKEFRKEATVPEQTTEAFKFLQENAKPGADVTGLHPDLATGLTAALKDLQKEGINLKVESGVLPGGDTKAAVESAAVLIKGFEGFISTAKIDSDGKFRVGYGSDTTTDASGRVSAVTKDTITTEEDAQRDLARRVVEFQDIAAKSIGEAWTGLSEQVKASITSVTYNYGHVPDTVAAAAKTGDNITIAEAIAALKANPSRRAEEAANVTAAPLSALGSSAPTIQNFGGGAQLSGITDENAEKVAAALSKHGIFVPNGDNVAQLGPTPLAESPGLLNALQAAKRTGDQAAVFQTLSPPGANKKATDSAERDASKDLNDAQAEQDAIEKQLIAENEQLALTKARATVVIGMAGYQKAHPDASPEDLAAQKQLLIAKQQQMEIDIADDKFQDQHANLTDAQFEQYHNNQVQQHGLDQQIAQDQATTRDARHDAIQGQEKLNALLTDRRALEKDLTVANESGDETKIDAVTAKLASNRTEFDQTAESVRKFWNEVGGSSADAGIAKLDRTVDAANRVHGKFQIVGLSAKETQELVRDFANDISSAIDTFAQEVANGVKPIQALGDAFRKFASDFLLQIAKMIIQTQIFKLLGITQGGETTGGGLLGGLAGGGAAAGASGGGGSIFSFLGTLFGAHHTGGLVGSPTMYRTVSPLVFAGARRYHTGGLAGLTPDEIPIIAKRNEEILTDDDPRHRDNQSGMAINNIVKQPKILNLWRVEDLMSAALNTPDGEKAIINYIRSNAGAVKGAIGG